MLNFSLPALVSHFILKKFSLGLFFFFHFVLKRCVCGEGGGGGGGGRVEWGQSGIGGEKICIGVRLCKQLHVMRLPSVYSLQNLMEIFSVLLKIHCVRL